MYLTIFYFSALLNLIVSVLIIYILIKFYKKEYNINYPIKILKSIIPHTSTTFFLPIVFCFLSTLDCTETHTSLYSSDLKCYSILYYINGGISIISIFLFIPINILNLMIGYDYTLVGNSNCSSKNTSKPEVFFAISKFFISVIFVGFNGNFKIHYYLIFSCNFFGLNLVILNFVYPRFNNYTLIFMNKFLSLTFFWASFVLFIGRITINNKFDGCLAIFFIIEPIFCLILLSSRKNIQNKLMDRIGREESFQDMLNQIQSFTYLIDNKENYRNAFVLLKGYISVYEESCPILECPLKKYINCIKYGNNGNAFLFQHVEFLYSNCLTRFPNQLEVKFAYALFLIERMNKKKQAGELLKGIDELSPSIEEQFIIYRCNKIIEDDFYDIRIDDDNNLDLIKDLEYKNLKTQLINLITNASNLYIDFWSQLFASHSSGNEDLSKLNECGTEINVLIDKINLIFEKMQKLKNDDYEMTKIYFDFINDILNDKEKGLKLKTLEEDIGEIIELPKEDEFFNVNPYSLSTNDKYQYIVVSAIHDSFGIITNISLSVSTIFGYDYKELVGKSLDIIMPEIFHKEHKKTLFNTLNEYKKEEIEFSNKNKNKKYKEVLTFGINKAKYLMELLLKTTLIQTENDELFFIASISKNQSFFHTNQNKDVNNHFLYVLTNKNLYIQNFTANAVSSLGLTSSVINNKIEISFFIKQFYQDFLQVAIKSEHNLTPEQKLKIKKKILLRKYRNPININWRKLDFFESRYISTKFDAKSSLLEKEYKHECDNFNDYFTLVFSEVKINEKVIGYLFRFEKIILSLKGIDNTLLPSKTLANKKSFNKIKSKLGNPIPKRKNFSNDLFLLSNEKSSFTINKNFIPNSTFNFELDINNLTFKGNDEIKSNNSLIEKMKQIVTQELDKLNENTGKDEENEEEEDEEDECSSEKTSSNNSSSSYHNNENLVTNLNEKIEPSDKFKNNSLGKSRTEDEYYKIDFTNIKYLKYDFKKHALNEVKNWERLSLIEIRLNEGKKEEEKDENIKNIDILNSMNLNKNQDINMIIGNDNIQDINLIKEIENALKKQESQESISLLNKMSCFVFILFIFMGGISLYYIIYSSSLVRKMGILVTNTYRLLIFNSIGPYYVRELTLLNNENYTLIPSKSSRDDYINKVLNKTFEVFQQYHSLLTITNSYNLKLKKKNKEKLEEKLETQNIQNDFSIKITKASMQSAFIESSASLFNIANKNISELIPTEQNIFFYLKNSLNILTNAYYTLGEIYMEELNNLIQRIQIKFIIGYIFILLILVFNYFIITYAYNKVSKKKESYIEVFFEIGISVIKSSLEKCEHFQKKLKNDNEEEDISILYEDYNKDNFIKTNQKTHENYSKINNSRKRNSQLSKIFKIRFGVFLIMVLFFFTFIFVIYYLYLEKILINEKYFQNQIIMENAFYIVFNCLREYLFDTNSTVRLIKSQNILLRDLEKIYEVRRDSMNYMNQHRKSLPYKFIDKYREINEKSPCDFKTEEYFDNYEECINYINGATQYGYTIMNSYFVEEIRFAKELSVVIIDLNKPMNNLTLTGTTYGQSLWPKDQKELQFYIQNDPINFFNYPTVNELNIVMSNLLIPYLIILKQTTIDVLTKFLNEAYIKFIIMMCAYLICIFLLFLFVWIPFVRKLNSIIYKTKNMLSIIPKEVLASISNIEKLLDIKIMPSNSNNKNPNQ